MSKKKFKQLNELVEGSKPTDKDGILEDVAILGQVSKNKRFYTDKAMAEAVKMYEGAIVHVNHGGKTRNAEDRFGTITNVRKVKNQLRGNLKYLTTHPMAERVKEDLDKGLDCFALSHSVDGEGYVKDGMTFVEHITKVHSVDVVTGAATLKNLRESYNEEDGAEPESDGSDEAMAQAQELACVAVLRDTSLDVAGKIDKIKKILEAHADVNEDSEDDTEEEAPKSEQITEQVTKLVTDLLAKAGKNKFAKIKVPAGPMNEQNQQNAVVVPTDRAALVAWLHKRD